MEEKGKKKLTRNKLKDGSRIRREGALLALDGRHGGLDLRVHGSRRLAKEWSENGGLKRCRAMILLDMIGDKDLTITIPKGCTKNLIDRALRLAQENGLGSKFRVFESDMIDDHVPFLEKGVPAIDLIDFNYGPGNAFWHTTQDSLDKISAQSIKAVADFALGLYWNIAED